MRRNIPISEKMNEFVCLYLHPELLCSTVESRENLYKVLRTFVDKEESVVQHRGTKDQGGCLQKERKMKNIHDS